MRQTGIFLLFIVLSFTLNPISIQGQNLDSLLNNKRVYTSVNIGDLPQPKIDGLLGDEIWSLGEWQGDFTQQQPVGNADPTEETYIKVLYDHSNLFVAIICQDDEPDLIRDIFDRRDALSGDMAGIALDSYE
ncbi:MAG: hydrolase, partial [Bacteroidetes bacterium]